MAEHTIEQTKDSLYEDTWYAHRDDWDPQDETKYYGIADRKYRKNNWPLEDPFWNAITKKNQNASSIKTASEEDELVKEFDSVEEARAFVEQELLARQKSVVFVSVSIGMQMCH